MRGVIFKFGVLKEIRTGDGVKAPSTKKFRVLASGYDIFYCILQ